MIRCSIFTGSAEHAQPSRPPSSYAQRSGPAFVGDPTISRKKIANFGGTTTFNAGTRCAWRDFNEELYAGGKTSQRVSQ